MSERRANMASSTQGRIGFFVLMPIALAVALTSCDHRKAEREPAPATPPASLEEAREAYAAAAEKAVASAKPFTDPAALAMRLSLPPERIRSFQSTGALPNVGAGLRLNYDCVENDYCICYGDDDCNDMFSGVCRDPSTGGRCYTSGNRVICTCIPKARA
jgi:hypothetical protein